MMELSTDFYLFLDRMRKLSQIVWFLFWASVVICISVPDTVSYTVTGSFTPAENASRETGNVSGVSFPLGKAVLEPVSGASEVLLRSHHTHSFCKRSILSAHNHGYNPGSSASSSRPRYFIFSTQDIPIYLVHNQLLI